MSCPLGWLRDNMGDYPLDQAPTHDVAALVCEEPQLSTCQDPVKVVTLDTLEHSQPILLASWLLEQPLRLDQLVSFMHSYKEFFAWSYSDLEGVPFEVEPNIF